jgi:hypothetical protein
VEVEMKILFILAISCQILVVSSSFGQKVSYDFDKNTNFEQFRTYKWVYIKGAEQLEAELDRQIRLALDAQLGEKGLSRVDGDKADLYVGYQTAVSQEEDIMSYSLNSATTLGGTTVYVGQLVLDLYDAATDALVWRGAVSKTINRTAKPEKRQKNLEKAAAKLLKNYPPKTKA